MLISTPRIIGNGIRPLFRSSRNTRRKRMDSNRKHFLAFVYGALAVGNVIDSKYITAI